MRFSPTWSLLLPHIPPDQYLHRLPSMCVLMIRHISTNSALREMARPTFKENKQLFIPAPALDNCPTRMLRLASRRQPISRVLREIRISCFHRHTAPCSKMLIMPVEVQNMRQLMLLVSIHPPHTMSSKCSTYIVAVFISQAPFHLPMAQFSGRSRKIRHLRIYTLRLQM